jgi:short-subunit dehydrogenase
MSKGYFIVVSSSGAHLKMPYASAYSTSKLAIGRLNEYIHIENPDVKTFTFHPGAINTEMAQDNPHIIEYLVDTLQLPACTLLRLTSGKDNHLRGRQAFFCVPVK